MLELRNLDICVGTRTLIKQFSATWPLGSLVAVLGPNGAGKSTFLNHIAGICLKTQGTVFLQGCDIFEMSPIDRAIRISSISQQDPSPLDTIVFDRISHGLFPLGGLSPKATRGRIEIVAQQLEIEQLLQRPLFTLSGGQRKKVHIARALVNQESDVFILDEPDASLDASTREKIIELLKTLSSLGKLVVVSLHHQDLAVRYADTMFQVESTGLPPHQHAPQTHLSF